MKRIFTINPAITENTECSIVKVCASFINLKVGVSFNYGVSLRFISLLALQTCWATFQAKNNVRSAPASSAFTLVSHDMDMKPELILLCATFTPQIKGYSQCIYHILHCFWNFKEIYAHLIVH